MRMMLWWTTQISRIGILISLLSAVCWADSAQLFEITMEQQTQHQARLILHLTAPVVHNVFMLTQPHRLVIDLNTTRLKNKSVLNLGNNGLLENVRSGLQNDDGLRVVFDLKMPVKFQSALLQTAGQQKHHLIITINTLDSALTPVVAAPPAVPKFSAPPVATLIPSIKETVTVAYQEPRDFLVMIDAGHGGIDPGAVGQQGILEKDVTLAIARKLEKLVWQDPHIKALMTRNEDKYLDLRTRADIARAHKANLFISIHADAMPNNNTAKGGSVYMLSPSGASSEAAEWLAQRENASDLIDGTRLRDKDEILASVLLDLSQNSALEASAYAGKAVLSALDRINQNHLDKVQQAAFMVLRSPDVPSILVETGFLSTPTEELKLADETHQQQIAQAIFDGIRTYLHDYVLQDTLLATLGDTKTNKH